MVVLSAEEVAVASFTLEGTTKVLGTVAGLNAILVVVSTFIPRLLPLNCTCTGVTPSKWETPQSIGVSLSSLPFTLDMLDVGDSNIACCRSSNYR